MFGFPFFKRINDKMSEILAPSYLEFIYVRVLLC